MNPESKNAIQWYQKGASDVFTELSSGEHGLASGEAEQRLAHYGKNKLPEAKQTGFFVLFLRQFQSPLIYILFIASVIVFFLGETVDAYVILSVLFVNAFIGMIQEGKARNALKALKSFAKSEATVIRDGKETVVDDEFVVPGDILVLREGDKVPADARLISANSLAINESALTGESNPVSKTPDVLLEGSLQTADQKNMIFRGTFVVSGFAKAVVIGTGLETVIGSISRKLELIDADVPLKRNIAYLSRMITIAVVVICALVFLLGIAYGKTAYDMFFTAVAVAVSLIPEGLPVVITLVLATGVYRMGKENALVKRLQAVEALGRAKVIAVDKTGTITENELMITKVYADGKLFDVTGSGYEPTGEIRYEGETIVPGNHPEMLLAGKVATFCADATVSFLEKEKLWKVAGDPTEAALLVFGEKIGFRKEELEREEPHVFDIPFDSRHKYHATVHNVGNDKLFLTVIGAPEVILDSAYHYWSEGRRVQLTDDMRQQFHGIVSKLSSEGLRVVGFAIHDDPPADVSIDTMPPLTFVGFFGMQDVMRPGVRESVMEAQRSGIRVVMITGDHMETARAIGTAAGIYKPGSRILLGKEIDVMDPIDLADPDISIYARVTPEHKLKIIQGFREKGDIIAMTGDGVNDALSLVAADLGVAMGHIGTDVAKESADIVLLDDNFRSIVSAIEEGRHIYRSIKNVILYLFSTGVGELLTIVAALSLAMPLPLLPVQILWLNLVTDGVLVLALALEPRKSLSKKAFHPTNYFVDKGMLVRIALMGTTMMFGTLYMFTSFYTILNPAKSWTVALTTLAVFQWFNAWNCRSSEKSVFSKGIFLNKYLSLAFIVTVALQLVAVYNPFMQKALHTVPLSLGEWVAIIGVSLSIIVVEEIRKLFHRREVRKLLNF